MIFRTKKIFRIFLIFCCIFLNKTWGAKKRLWNFKYSLFFHHLRLWFSDKKAFIYLLFFVPMRKTLPCFYLKSSKFSLLALPNKQNPVENTWLFGVFHMSDPWISRDNSRVDKVNLDDLMTGLGCVFTRFTRDFYMRKLISSHTFFMR